MLELHIVRRCSSVFALHTSLLWQRSAGTNPGNPCGGLAGQVGRMEQMETAAEAKAKRGPKATIRRELLRVHTPATATGEPLALPSLRAPLCPGGDTFRVLPPHGSTAGRQL